jgi:hypothetical protein
LQYEVSDRRDAPRILRRTPGIHHVTKDDLDDNGDPKPLTADEIHRAAMDSAYTGRPTSLSDAGEAVDEKTQRRFTDQGQTIDELRERRRRETYEREREALSAYERLRIEIERAERLGTDVHRELAAVLRTIENVRRKNNRRAA